MDSDSVFDSERGFPRISNVAIAMSFFHYLLRWMTLFYCLSGCFDIKLFSNIKYQMGIAVVMCVGGIIGIFLGWIVDSYTGKFTICFIFAVLYLCWPSFNLIHLHLIAKDYQKVSILCVLLWLPVLIICGTYECFLLEQLEIPRYMAFFKMYAITITFMEFASGAVVMLLVITLDYLPGYEHVYLFITFVAVLIQLVLFLFNWKNFNKTPIYFGILRKMLSRLCSKCECSRVRYSREIEYIIESYYKRTTNVFQLLLSLSVFISFEICMYRIWIQQIYLFGKAISLPTAVAIISSLNLMPLLMLPIFLKDTFRHVTMLKLDLYKILIGLTFRLIAVLFTVIIQYFQSTSAWNTISKGYAHARIYNSSKVGVVLTCSLLANSLIIEPLDTKLLVIKGSGSFIMNCSVEIGNKTFKNNQIKIVEGILVTLVIRDSSLDVMTNQEEISRDTESQKEKNTMLRMSRCYLITGNLPPNEHIQVHFHSEEYFHREVIQNITHSIIFRLQYRTYVISLYSEIDRMRSFTGETVDIQTGGRYAFLVYIDHDNKSWQVKTFVLIEPLQANIYWMIPQFFFYAISLPFSRFSIKQFLFLQTPIHVRSFVFSVYYLLYHFGPFTLIFLFLTGEEKITVLASLVIFLLYLVAYICFCYLITKYENRPPIEAHGSPPKQSIIDRQDSLRRSVESTDN